MIVLSDRCVGLIHQCIGCGAVLAYGMADIYENFYLRCPICKEKQKVPLVWNYDGVVKEKENNEENSNE